MRRILVCLAALAALAAPVSAAQAATIVVDTTEASSATDCTLPDAIVAANTDNPAGKCAAGGGAPDRIEFALPPGATIVPTATLEISDDLEIVGPGASALTISGNHGVQVFHIAPSTHASIADLTIADGKSGFGGAIWNQGSPAEPSLLELIGVTLRGNEAVSLGGSSTSAGGGAVYNQGSLELIESAVEENLAKAANASGANGANGGGIESTSSGTVVLERSTVRNNDVVALGSGGASQTTAHGGGISNFAVLTLRESTLSGNEVSATGGGMANNGGGGGIGNANSSGVKVTIERSTIAGNTVTAPGAGAGGGFTAESGSFLISGSTIVGNSAPFGANAFLQTAAPFRSTIVAKPLGGGVSCYGVAPASEGFNLDEGTSCGFNQASDQHGVDPQLAASLADNGGPTETLALLDGSPAIDRGSSAPGENEDQRGFQRPVEIVGVPDAPGGDGADVGAYEVQAPRATIVRGPAEGETIADPEPTFEFTADAPGATFTCSLDGAAPVPCTSPYKLPRLSDGTQAFSVAATAANGYGQPAATRTFAVDTRVEPPPVPPPHEGPAKAPETKITGLPGKTTKRVLKIRFSSNQAGSTFACKLDKRKWRSCRSPFKTPKLKLGRHTFWVKATGPTGVVDPTPAKKSFRVVRPPKVCASARPPC